MGLDLNALQDLMNKVNSTTLADAMAAYFNGSANASVAFAMLDPESAAAVQNMLNGTDLSQFIGSTATTNSTGSTGSMAGMTPVPVPTIKMPPLPRPGIFDAPSNPYLDGLDTGNSTLSSLMAGLSPAAQNEAQVMLINEMIKAAKKKAFEISMLLLLGYTLVLLFNAVLIIHIRYNRHLATKGDSTAARKIVLPAFEPLLWTYAILCCVYIAFFGGTIHADFMSVQSTFVTIEFSYSCKQVLYLLVPINMMQKSLSVPALLRSLVITFFASFYTIPVVWLMQDYGRDDQQFMYYWIMWTSRWLTFLPFIYVCIWPPARSSVRAFREYFFFYLVVQMLYLSACEIFHQGGSIDLGTRFGWASACWVGVLPYFIWRIIRADTEHWRGIGKRAVELQTLFRRKGAIEERISAKGLHVLIEMHRKFIIDFANLDIQHKIGEGTNSIVFRGRLNAKQTPVGIKVFTPSNVNEDVVAEFSHEAALCGALQHPNILKFYGMCVCPPTICFVTELCQGSLYDITRSMAKKGVVNPHRQQFLINIGYMVDAARAVAYLHSFSPPYVHRDIRPSSFLVDVEGSVKLTDFGASRTLSVRNAHLNTVPVVSTTQATGVVSRSGTQTVLSAPQMQPVRAEAANDVKRMPEYMAPEVIRSKNAGASMYGEAADIYALAMTMWDILYPEGSKYTSSVRTATTGSGSTEQHRDSYNHRESEIFERVFAGHRPPLDEHVYPPLRELIQSAWHPDPRMRPRAMHIVKALEIIQEETCAVYAAELIDELDCGAGSKGAGIGIQHHAFDANHVSFQGARAIERMYALQHVTAEFEAVRLGNMFMDAGLMHHIKHLRSFEYSAALYFFDEEAVHQCSPLAMLEDGTGTPGASMDGNATAAGSRSKRPGSRRMGGAATTTTGAASRKMSRGGRQSHASSDAGGGRDSNLMMDNHLGFVCSCRKLGQKLESAQTTRSRLRLKFKSNDENLLTARLLADEPNGDFEEFQDQHGQDANVGRLA